MQKYGKYLYKITFSRTFSCFFLKYYPKICNLTSKYRDRITLNIFEKLVYLSTRHLMEKILKLNFLKCAIILEKINLTIRIVILTSIR